MREFERQRARRMAELCIASEINAARPLHARRVRRRQINAMQAAAALCLLMLALAFALFRADRVTVRG